MMLQANLQRMGVLQAFLLVQLYFQVSAVELVVAIAIKHTHLKIAEW